MMMTQRDLQIKKLLTENARYLQDTGDCQSNLKKLKAEFDEQIEELEEREAHI